MDNKSSNNLDNQNNNQRSISEDDLKRLFGEDSSLPTQSDVNVEFKPEGKPPQPQPPSPAPSAIPITHPAHPIPQLKEVRKVYHEKNVALKLVLKFIGFFILIFAISFTIINSQAIFKKIKYSWQKDYQNQTTTNNLPAVKKTESHLIIPKINVDAPIIWNVDENDIIDNLQNGVVHYKGTALPGQKGNIFISGHSSYYVWAPGNYKDIFATLNKVDVGDNIYIFYNGAKFTYEVTGRKTVWPDDLSVLDQGSSNNLTLMTCVPIGTNLQRLVVTTKQVSSN